MLTEVCCNFRATPHQGILMFYWGSVCAGRAGATDSGAMECADQEVACTFHIDGADPRPSRLHRVDERTHNVQNMKDRIITATTLVNPTTLHHFRLISIDNSS